MKKHMEDACKRIRLYRRTAGMTLQEFADRLHKSKATVSKYENGLISIDLETLYDISKVLDIPLDKILCTQRDVPSDKNFSNGMFYSRQYLYSFARGKLTRSIIDHYHTEQEGVMGAQFFYDIPSFEEPERCKGFYEGTMYKKGTVLNYQFVNKRYNMEHTFLCCLESLDNNGYNMGLMSSIASNTLMPNAIKVLISDVCLPEDSKLEEMLLFSKEDVKRMKRDNMLTIERR